jgi:hypothetical protein
MDAIRMLAGGLSVNRVLSGAGNVVRPASARWSWVGRAAKKPGAQLMIRSQGARDVALGLGALHALARRPDSEARAWFAAHTLTDAVDVLATLAVLDDLPKRRARMALALAGGSTAIALLGAVGLRSPGSRPPDH